MSLTAIACDQQKTAEAEPASSSAAATSAPSEPAPGLKDLKATVNGEQLTLQSAVAFSKGGRAIEVTFSTATPPCEDFAGNGRMLARDEQNFSVTIAPQLNTDGTENWAVARKYFNSSTQQGRDLGELTISTADVDKGVKGTLAFNIEVDANEFMKTPKQKLEVKGPFEAKGCGAFKSDREQNVPARPQPSLKLTIAGKAFDVQGATLKPTEWPKPGHNLTLSTQPLDCGDSYSGDRDIKLELTLVEGRAVFAYLGGSVLPTQLNMTPSESDESIQAKTEEELDGTGEITLAMSGSMNVLDYKVEMTGDVTVPRCPKRK